MNSALQQALLDEFDETDDAVFNTSEAMSHFGFDKLKLMNFQAIVNRNVTAKNQKSRS
jgi:hypothetical protein